LKSAQVAVGKGVSFFYHGFRMGKVLKIKGNTVTVVMAPYKVRGKHTGVRKRIKMQDILGVVYRKKVVPCQG